MPASQGLIGFGSTLKVSTDGTTYTALVQTESITLPIGKRANDTVTNLGSPAVGPGPLVERIATSWDPGTASFTIAYLPGSTTIATLRTAATAATVLSFEIELPTFGTETAGETFTFSGFLDSDVVPSDITVDKHLTAKVSVQCTTAVAFTAATLPS
jgi:hypothetical protein